MKKEQIDKLGFYVEKYRNCPTSEYFDELVQWVDTLAQEVAKKAVEKEKKNSHGLVVAFYNWLFEKLWGVENPDKVKIEKLAKEYQKLRELEEEEEKETTNLINKPNGER